MWVPDLPSGIKGKAATGHDLLEQAHLVLSTPGVPGSRPNGHPAIVPRACLTDRAPRLGL